MYIINNLDSQRFEIDGVPYYKNFLSFIAGNKICIYNAYDRRDERIKLIDSNQITLDGVVYVSAITLQAAILPVIYTRNTLGAGVDLSTKEDKVSGVIATGTDNYIATVTEVTTLTTGYKILCNFENPNTGASTINVNGLGVKQIVKENDVQMVAGDLLGTHLLMYNGTKFQIVGHVPSPTDTFKTKAVASTGNTIQFDKDRIYNSIASPTTGTMTNNLTGAQIGVIQKIYYNHSTTNPFPAGWVRLGSKTYTPSALNIIYAEWVGSSRVEYWISQEA